eukprot:8251572-Alexandrium_andersonii.AAC.1
MELAFAPPRSSSTQLARMPPSACRVGRRRMQDGPAKRRVTQEYALVGGASRLFGASGRLQPLAESA